MIREKALYLYILGIGSAFVLLLFSLDLYGRHSRVSGKGGAVGEQGVRIVHVDSPEECFSVWEKEGFKGRVVVSLSRRLNFEVLDEDQFLRRTSFPLNLVNLSAEAKKRLNSRNFLYISLKTGIAREIVHVVPESVFPEKADAAQGVEGVSVLGKVISAPHLGTPRLITSVHFSRSIEEPVLLYVNASIFGEQAPEAILRNLQQVGLKTDLVVLCRSSNDSEVTPMERGRIERFGELLGDADGMGR